eukprot:1178757-Prorocentrum_minimum.AAC.5
MLQQGKIDRIVLKKGGEQRGRALRKFFSVKLEIQNCSKTYAVMHVDISGARVDSSMRHRTNTERSRAVERIARRHGWFVGNKFWDPRIVQLSLGFGEVQSSEDASPAQVKLAYAAASELKSK